jgi:hypothetical protein
MAEVDKQLTFNAFHIYMVIFVINLFINGNYDYIINFINYLMNTEAPWFLILILHKNVTN